MVSFLSGTKKESVRVKIINNAFWMYCHSTVSFLVKPRYYTQKTSHLSFLCQWANNHDGGEMN